jgi:hypothetical protein
MHDCLCFDIQNTNDTEKGASGLADLLTKLKYSIKPPCQVRLQRHVAA